MKIKELDRKITEAALDVWTHDNDSDDDKKKWRKLNGFLLWMKEMKMH